MRNAACTTPSLPLGQWRLPGWPGLALVGLAMLPAAACGQAPDSLAAVAQPLQRHQQRTLVEKLYVHLDRPVYTARETMWLKLYAVDGTFHRPLDLSKVTYVEVLNALGQPVLQTQLALRQATGHGALDLPASLPTGRYTVRAYTSWMKNFDPEFYFQTPVTIINTFAASGPPAAATKAPAYDVQFFPEGGQLVQGVPGRVAFRVTDAVGRGQTAAGTVRDGQGRVVATFRTLQFGLGSFPFTPTQPGAAYKAELQLATGQKLVQLLPAAAAQGYVLRLTAAGPAQLRLHVVAKGMGADAARLALVAHSGQRVAAAQVAQPNAQGEADFLVSTSALGPGVSHFTVFNSHRQPVGERLYFGRPRPLTVAVAASQARYGLREKVTLRLTGSLTTAANLSLAVYQLDSLAAAAMPTDISSALSLTSDLKGHVENPGYYLRDSSQTGQEAADNLMLTHGWSRFQWQDVLANKAPALPYAPEINGPVVRAQVLTVAGAPAAGVVAYLAAPSRAARFYTATTGPDGIALFEPKDAAGPRRYTLQTDWRRDSTSQLALLAPYSTRYAARPLAPLLLSPALAPDLTRRHLQTQLQTTYYGRFRQEPLPPHDTVAFYGTPRVQYRLDDYTRFKTLEEVLREYVQGAYLRQGKGGFRLQMGDQLRRGLFEQEPLVLLDGVPVFDVNKFLAFDPLRIQRVAVFPNRYFYGRHEYEGLLSFTTYQGDLQGFPLAARALLEEYEGVQGQREFFAPRYDAAPSSLPDLRNLLHWLPDLTLPPGATQEVTFYTSDQVGRYRVVVQGLGANGQAGTASAVFEVKPAL